MVRQNLPAALDAQKVLEGAAVTAEPCFGPHIQLMRPEVATREHLGHGEGRKGRRAVGTALLRNQGIIVHNVGSTLQVQRAELPVRPPAAVVVDTEGGVGVLLDLGDQGAGADGMDRAGQDGKDIALLDRDAVEHLADAAVLGTAEHFVPGQPLGEAEIQKGLGYTVDDVPHLGLAALALFWQGAAIRGMHLNGQILPRVDQFYQDGELVPPAGFAPEAFSVQRTEVGNRHTLQRPVRHAGHARRVRGKLPALGREIGGVRFAEFLLQPVPAPEGLFIAGLHAQWCQVI